MRQERRALQRRRLLDVLVAVRVVPLLPQRRRLRRGRSRRRSPKILAEQLRERLLPLEFERVPAAAAVVVPTQKKTAPIRMPAAMSAISSGAILRAWSM